MLLPTILETMSAVKGLKIKKAPIRIMLLESKTTQGRGTGLSPCAFANMLDVEYLRSRIRRLGSGPVVSSIYRRSVYRQSLELTRKEAALAGP